MLSDWLDKRSGRDTTAGRPVRARAVRPPATSHGRGLAGRSRPPAYRRSSTKASSPAAICRFAVTAPVAPSRQGRLRQAGDCGPSSVGQHQSRGIWGQLLHMIVASLSDKLSDNPPGLGLVVADSGG